MDDRNKIKESELILHPDGSVYHLKLKPENIAKTIILVGDPQRVEIVSNYFDKIEYKGHNREIITHTGYLNNCHLTVMSSGMGTDNIDIVLNELDALVNIDLKSRTIKDKHTPLDIIRLGTSGAIQPDIPLNTLILSEYGLGLDGLLNFYKGAEEIMDSEITRAFIAFANWRKSLPRPYVVKCSHKLARLFDDTIIRGITATAPGFYGPQGRHIRLSAADPEINEKLRQFSFEDNRITNYEMETSALYGLGRMLGHNTLTICAAIANRNRLKYNHDYKIAIERLIEKVLEKLVARN